MSRSERLLDLLQVLRRHRRPVSGRALAEEIGVSLRTLYRDIASLQAQGATIEGEPGVGYVLRPGFLLPPLMFTRDEIEALALGARWVTRRGDDRLREAALNALARIGEGLPPDLRAELENESLLIGQSAAAPADTVDPLLLRTAIRTHCKLTLTYRDGAGASSDRVVWPIALGYFDQVRLLVAWCELRVGFRSFRTDRIVSAALMDLRYPKRRQDLLREWRDAEKISTRNA